MTDDAPRPRRRLVDRLAARDPTGVMPEALRIGRRLPGAAFLERQGDRIERAVVGELRRRLEIPALPAGSDDGGAPAPGRDAGHDGAPRSDGRPGRSDRGTANGAAPDADPTATMEQLLQRSVAESRDDSRRSLFRTLLSEMVPDEARILAALADGRPFAVIHIATPGSHGTIVLENASSVGRSAGVTLVDQVPTYLSHLRGLGLVEIGPSHPSLSDEYAVLLTDRPVQEARQRARAGGRRPARIIRRSVRISALGAELWRSTRPAA
ncbi:MAG: DUF4393 domain-containing protein [Solirubrobacteraceae bacterium]|nr:DUF4393 domain-containing protein [Solirubrobacteraceae bacterium]